MGDISQKLKKLPRYHIAKEDYVKCYKGSVCNYYALNVVDPKYINEEIAKDLLRLTWDNLELEKELKVSKVLLKILFYLFSFVSILLVYKLFF